MLSRASGVGGKRVRVEEAGIIWSRNNDLPCFRTKQLNITAFKSGTLPHEFRIRLQCRLLEEEKILQILKHLQSTVLPPLKRLPAADDDDLGSR